MFARSKSDKHRLAYAVRVVNEHYAGQTYLGTHTSYTADRALRVEIARNATTCSTTSSASAAYDEVNSAAIAPSFGGGVRFRLAESRLHTRARRGITKQNARVSNGCRRAFVKYAI